MIIEGTEAWANMLGKRGYGSAPKAVPMKRDWRNGIYPVPVYVATFADGQTIRMSFWNRIGKPWDVQRGRALCASWHRTMTGRDCDIIAGHVEHDGHVQDTAAKPARKRVTTKQLKTALANLIRLPELPIADQADAARRLVAEARELIAA
jgi:hypothetical protein